VGTVDIHRGAAAFSFMKSTRRKVIEEVKAQRAAAAAGAP
jgi:hypothetical protein